MEKLDVICVWVLFIVADMKNSSLILLYNNAEYLPFHLSSGFESKGWEVTLDKRLIGKAAVVVFHLPTLLDVLSEELEKQKDSFGLLGNIRENENGDSTLNQYGEIYLTCIYLILLSAIGNALQLLVLSYVRIN